MVGTIEVRSDADWEAVTQAGLRVVVDPMVFRTADVFLRGAAVFRRSLTPPETMWSAVSSNVGALCAFFDAFVLEDNLPMYDYDMTFPPDIDSGRQALTGFCNREGQTLVPVRVGGTAYDTIKTAAVAALSEVPPVPDSGASEIIGELSAFDYEWRPDIWREDGPTDPEDRLLDTFRFAGLLFSGYAQRLGADHVLQPKRERLYLAASLGSTRVMDERALFAELDSVARETPGNVIRTGDLPNVPTFLPYLLRSDPSSPADVLTSALRLRRSGPVGDYRAWRRNALDELENGRISTSVRRDIQRISRDIRQYLDIPETTISAKVGAKVGLVGPEVGAEIGFERAVSLGWLLRALPKRRYRKLLMKLIISQREYTNIDRALRKLWFAA